MPEGATATASSSEPPRTLVRGLQAGVGGTGTEQGRTTKESLELLAEKITTTRASVLTLERAFKEYISFKRAQLQHASGGGKTLDFDAAEQLLPRALHEFQERKLTSHRQEERKETESKETQAALLKRVADIKAEFSILSHINHAYPQILREFTGVGETLALDLLFGKFYVALNRAGIMEVWQAMPQIKALEYVILPPELGVLTMVRRIRAATEPDLPNAQALTQNQEVRFVLANSTGHLYLLHVRFKWNEERRTLNYHRYVLGASRKVCDGPVYHLELGPPSMGHFMVHGPVAAAGEQEFLISLNERLEEGWCLPFELVRAAVQEKVERVYALSKLRGTNAVSSAGRPKLLCEEELNLNSITMELSFERLLVLLQSGDLVVLKRCKNAGPGAEEEGLSVTASTVAPATLKTREVTPGPRDLPKYTLLSVGTPSPNGLYRYILVAGTDGPVIGYTNSSSTPDLLRHPTTFQFLSETVSSKYISTLSHVEQVRHYRNAERVCAVAFFMYQELPLFVALTRSGILSLLRVSEPTKPLIAMHTGLGRLRLLGRSAFQGEGTGPSSKVVTTGPPAGRRRPGLPLLRVVAPSYVCLATLGAKDWVSIDLKPTLSHFAKQG